MDCSSKQQQCDWNTNKNNYERQHNFKEKDANPPPPKKTLKFLLPLLSTSVILQFSVAFFHLLLTAEYGDASILSLLFTHTAFQ